MTTSYSPAHTKRLSLLGLSLLLCLLSATTVGQTLLDRKTLPVKVQSGSSNTKPNILIIQTDDLGFDDLSIHGNQSVETPSIDQLARESVQFDQFSVASVCAPTRASLLTGRDFWRTGVSGVHAGKDFLNLDETTFADVFRANGYKTGMWGKWHTGKTDGYFPWDRGFDEGFYAKLYHYQNNKGILNGQEHQTQGWVSRAIADFAIDFIDRNKNAPFLAYVSFLTPHTPWEAPENLIQKYRNRGQSESLATVNAMIDQMDQQTGRILQALDQNGLRNNTLVLFLSDNGPERNDGRLGWMNDSDWALRNNRGLRGKKGQNFENGVKSSLFVRYPNKYNPATVNRLVDISDIYPTILDVAGINHTGSKSLDGRSIRPYLEGNTSTLSEGLSITSQWHPFEFAQAQEHNPVVNKGGLKFDEQNVSIRNERYRLTYFWGGKHLYDLQNDPLEQNNLYSTRQDLVNTLRAPLESWFEEILSTPGSFNAPLFKIGLNGHARSDVKAYGPKAINGNVVNRSHKIEGFSRSGDYAEYRVEIVTSGNYRLSLAHASTSATTNMTAHFDSVASAQIQVKPGNWSTANNSVYLNKGFYTLKLQLDSNWKPFDSLTEIVFDLI